MSGSESHRSASPRPRIGITTYLEQATQGVWDVRASFLPEVYLTSVTRAGGAAMLLPPQDPADADTVVAVLDGLVITGGADVAPELYGAERHPTTDSARADRDAWEMALFAAASHHRVPVLAICRGLQLVNVAMGGSLMQHLPESLGTEKYRKGGGEFTPNPVQVMQESALARVVGDGPLTVQSYHHQGIERLADGLVASATSEDGLVQAFEGAGENYLVGVQWHPEQDDDGRLFVDLIAQARRRTAETERGTR